VIGRNVPAVLVAGAVGTLTGTLWCVIPAAIYTRWLTGEGQRVRQSAWSRFKQRMGFGSSVDSRVIRIRPIDPATQE
jgi:hypothetical protein